MIKRVLFSALVLVAPLAFSSPAQASSDSTCYPDWKVKQTVMNGCSGLALLSPGNDTRINLLMLLHDRHGDVGVSNVPSYYANERRGDAQPFDYGIFASALSPQPTDDAGGGSFYGTRCISNEKGARDFEAAVAAAKGVSAAERTLLNMARQALQPECGEGSDMRSVVAKAVESVTSKSGREFADYLRGAAAFYDGDFATARAQFQALAKASAAWPKEAASYMLGRVELNQAMESSFDEYGSLADNPNNRRELDAAERAFKAYIQTYPQGRYAVSASGLLRKVYWLTKAEDKLLAEYVRAFGRKNLSGSSVTLADLVQEMDVKVGTGIDRSKVSDPNVLAMLVLMAMRHSDDSEMQGDDKPISRPEIEALRSRFGGQEALYNYLLAAHALYVAKNPDAVLRLIPASAGGGGYLGHSQQALRALALDAKGDPGARAALAAAVEAGRQPFQRATMELALAMHEERNAGLDRVFATGSPVKDPEVREILLRYNAGPKLLRAQAVAKDVSKQEREVALYTLLYKNITRGAYKDFLKDQALIPAGARPKPADDYTAPPYTDIAIFKWPGARADFACPSLTTLATALAGAPKDAPSLICLGEFSRLNGLDPGGGWLFSIPHSLDKLPPKDELGGTPSLFPGKPFSRLELYKGVIADPAASPTSKAYALYRAVYCYGPSGYNSCGGVEVPLSQRKAWFNQLKKNYPTSPWATQLKYYW
jgi:TolA-binding protein